MKEYAIKGLSCANCARQLEKTIQSLPHGETAILNYASSTLKVEETIAVAKINQILSSDGAALVLNDDEPEPFWTKEKQLIAALALSIIAYFVVPHPYGSIVAIVLSGYGTFMKGLRNLTKFVFTMDTLMTIALIGAAAIGEWKEAAVVAMLFGVNEYLERIGMSKARQSLQTLLQLAPKKANVIRQGKEVTIAIESLNKNDVAVVRPGEQIPSDGVIIEGASTVNEAAITGESVPVDKEVGANVFGGTINETGVIRVKIASAYNKSALAKILQLVKEAQETKTPLELSIQKFAKYYTPVILLIALLVAVVPSVITGDYMKWIYEALAILIVGCPCALILSSPIALLAGITTSARHGVLIKGGVYLEQLAKVKTIAFDKTGTITKGKMRVVEAHMPSLQAWEIAGAIEAQSTHPIARAVLAEAKQHVTEFPALTNVTNVAGEGIVATMNGVDVWLGNEKRLRGTALTGEQTAILERYKAAGYTIVIVGTDREALGLIAVADELREEASAVMAKLKQLGMKQIVMLTGDHEKTAANIASLVGIDYRAQLLPEEKVQFIRQWRKEGEIAMVGDGVNDTPALVEATVGIAMGKGTDSAIETAHVVLMKEQLEQLPAVIQLAKLVTTIIKVNITIALGLKAIALLLSAFGVLTLWFAILADMGATIVVTLISLLVLLYRPATKKSVRT